jgi:signal transduction histidine kinase/CheY-like chemotaxis protein
MLNKKILLEEICPSIVIGSDNILESFVDEKIEADFRKYDNIKNRKAELVTSFFIIIYYLAFIISSIIDKYSPIIYVINIFLLLIDICCTIGILTIKNTSTQVRIRLVKFCLNTLNGFFIISIMILYEEEAKDNNILKNFYMLTLILLSEYMFLVRTSSKILFFSLFSGLLILLIFASTTTYTVDFKLSNNDVLIFPMTKSCNTVIDYKNKISQKSIETNKLLDTAILNTVLENDLNSTSIINFADLLENEIILIKSGKKSIIENLDIFSLLSLIKLDKTNPNNFLVNLFADIYKNYVQKILRSEERAINCLKYYNMDLLANGVFMVAYYFNLETSEGFVYSKFTIEMATCLLSPILYYLMRQIFYNRRDIFIKVMQTEVLMNNYNNLLNNIPCQVVSLTKEKLIFYNKSFLNCLNESKKYQQTELKSLIKEPLNLQAVNNHISELFLKSKNSELITIETKNTLSDFAQDFLINNHNDYELENNLNFINQNLSYDIHKNYSNVISEHEEMSSEFKFIGEFSKSNQTFYSVYFRKTKNKINNIYILDIILNDVTDIKKAEIINFETKFKQKLFSKMAHEFKTPLIIIKTLINQQVNIRNKNQRLINSKNISNMSDYISFLINDIIYYSNDKQIKITKEKVNVHEILSFCEGVTKSLICSMPGNKQDIKVILDLEKDINLYEIESDKVRLTQVLLNFISNAVKFTKFGEIILAAKIELYDSTKDLGSIIDDEFISKTLSEKNECDDSKNIIRNKYSSKLIISISDTGIGLKEEDLNKILNYNNDELLSINTDYEYNKMGTGLGIGISKSILNKLNYKLNVQSELGRGTKFIIEIPNPIKKEKIEQISMNSICVTELTKFKNTFSNLDYSNLNSSITSYDSSISINNEISINSLPKDKFSKSSDVSDNICLRNSNLKFVVKDKIKSENINKKNKYSKKEIIKNAIKIDKEIISINGNNQILKKDDKEIINNEFKIQNQILIVDDSNTLRSSLKNLLNSNIFVKTNFSVLEANDGISMLNTVIENQRSMNKIKLIVSDENMEYMAGSEAFEILRTYEKLNKVSKILLLSLTAFSDEETISKIKKKGADEVLSKPLSCKDLDVFLKKYSNILK